MIKEERKAPEKNNTPLNPTPGMIRSHVLEETEEETTSEYEQFINS